MNFWSALALMVAVIAVSAAFAWVAYVFMQRYLDQQEQERKNDLEARKQKEFMPLQVQAYERLILYLERINPERLVFRANKPGMSARQLQSEIMKIMREEFDHNLAQQLYIGQDAWENVKAAREETLNILNVAAERVHKDANSLEFSQAILEVTAGVEKLPTDVAIRILKKEFRAKVSA